MTVEVPPIVYAYHDGGEILPGIRTRWCPRVVACTHTADHSVGEEANYAVKFRRRCPGINRVSTAAAVSEVLCHALLRVLQIRTLDIALINVSPPFARSYALEGLVDYDVEVGLHFGSKLRRDFDPGPPESWEQLEAPEELIEIWAADSWLMNLDRNQHGNLLMELSPSGKFYLIAADQSDCFLGATSLTDGTFLTRSSTHGPAPYLPFLQRALMETGCRPLMIMAERIQGASDAIKQALDIVPLEWWYQSGISRQEMMTCLHQRADRIREILQIDHWRKLTDATQGGIQLDL